MNLQGHRRSSIREQLVHWPYLLNRNMFNSIPVRYVGVWNIEFTSDLNVESRGLLPTLVLCKSIPPNKNNDILIARHVLYLLQSLIPILQVSVSLLLVLHWALLWVSSLFFYHCDNRRWTLDLYMKQEVEGHWHSAWQKVLQRAFVNFEEVLLDIQFETIALNHPQNDHENYKGYTTPCI